MKASNPNSDEKLEQIPCSTNFQVEIAKKHLALQIYYQLCSMTSTYLGRKYVHFWELLLSKNNENAAFIFKITQHKVKDPLFSFLAFCCVMIGGCPNVLNKNVDEVYSSQLRSYNPTNRKNA